MFGCCQSTHQLFQKTQAELNTDCYTERLFPGGFRQGTGKKQRTNIITSFTMWDRIFKGTTSRIF